MCSARNWFAAGTGSDAGFAPLGPKPLDEPLMITSINKHHIVRLTARWMCPSQPDAAHLCQAWIRERDYLNTRLQGEARKTYDT